MSDEEKQRQTAERNTFTVKDRRWWANGGKTDGAEAPEPEQPSYVVQLETQLAERDQKLAELRERQRTALAELERSRGRIERDAERQVELARRDLVRGFLDLVDDLDRAIDAAQTDDHVDGALLQGVELVKRRFLAKLAELGVTPDDPIGEAFNPAHHEAVSMVPVADPAHNGHIIAVIKPGYRIGDEILRPALVAVGRGGLG
jgi:molecular chaperone GrpE